MARMRGLVAIVTGASRGLMEAGRSPWNTPERAPTKVVVSARRQSPTGLTGTVEETAQAIRDAPGGEALDGLAPGLRRHRRGAGRGYGPPHRGGVRTHRAVLVLFNNAGVMSMGETIEDIDPDWWDQIMRINTRGPYLCCRAALPTMIAECRGSIINVGSRAGTNPRGGGGVAYSASKAAVHMFTFCLAEEVRRHNIAVNALSPGPMKSEGSAAIPFTKGDWHERVEPADVGPCAVWLALQDAQSFTGQLALRAEFGETWGT